MLQQPKRASRQLPYLPIVQTICPHPGRLLQRLIVENDLRTGLDIGCGSDSLLTPARSERFQSTGIDIFPQSIENARRNQQHDHYICADFRELEIRPSLPSVAVPLAGKADAKPGAGVSPGDGRFDVVVLNHVIEHFERDEGWEVLKRIEALARRIVYVGTPNGFIEQTGYGGNPFQRHLSGWFPHDFAARGYNVFGTGPKQLRGVEARPRYFPEAIVKVLERGSKWYYYRRPEKSFAIAAIKYIDAENNIRQL